MAIQFWNNKLNFAVGEPKRLVFLFQYWREFKIENDFVTSIQQFKSE